MPYECDECHEPIINEIPCPLCRCCFDCCMCNIEPATQEEVDLIEKEYEFSVHLQADEDLHPLTAEAIGEMVRCAYAAIRQGKIGKQTKMDNVLGEKEKSLGERLLQFDCTIVAYLPLHSVEAATRLPIADDMFWVLSTKPATRSGDKYQAMLAGRESFPPLEQIMVTSSHSLAYAVSEAWLIWKEMTKI